MNIIITLTKPLTEYRDQLLSALKAHGPYTENRFVVVCSTHEPDYNTDTYDSLREMCDDVILFPFSLSPYDADKRSLPDYMNEVMGYNMWRLKIEGETCYLPAGYLPSADSWTKKVRANYRECGELFYGPLEGVDTERWINGPFVCDAAFITTNPCVRGYNKNQSFMYRARNYTNRSCTGMTDEFFTHTSLGCDTMTVDDLKEGSSDLDVGSIDLGDADEVKVVSYTEPKRVKKKTAKKKRAKKKAAKKKTAKPSIKDTLKDLRDNSSDES